MTKSDEIYTEEELERIDAVNRYQRGERPTKICKSLGRSRVWLRKWIRRYNDSETSSKTRWFKEESRAPNGDPMHPRHFSRVVRLCLHLGIEPVFIAPSKPWMNGTIEDFNGDFGVKLWEREQWTDLEDIRREAKTFLMRHNNRQDWKYRKANLEAIPHRKLPEDFEIGADSLPITEGKVHFIRQVKGDGTISGLNEDFDAGESLVHEYVWATIDTKQEIIKSLSHNLANLI